jgi:hypothetical protein
MSDIFCGACGGVCIPIVHRARIIDSAHGVTRRSTEITAVSDCCKSEDLYTDPELETEAEDEDLIPV